MHFKEDKHTQTVAITDQEIEVFGKTYWVEAKAIVTGTLTEESQSLECHGAPCTLTEWFFDAEEADLYEFNLVELDDQGNETEVTDEAIIDDAKRQVKELAMGDAEADLEL